MDVLPEAIPEIITDLCAIDLSAGTLISPLRPWDVELLFDF
jgi:hypothetical protein